LLNWNILLLLGLLLWLQSALVPLLQVLLLVLLLLL
jgi:hypothetical protein